MEYKASKSTLRLIVLIGIVLIFAWGIGIIVIIVGWYMRKNQLLTLSENKITIKSGSNETDIPYSKLNSISVVSGVTLLFKTGNDTSFNFTPEKDKISEIKSYIEEKVSKNSTNILKSENEPHEIEKLYGMMEKGIITKDEFEAKKKKILDN